MVGYECDTGIGFDKVRSCLNSLLVGFIRLLKGIEHMVLVSNCSVLFLEIVGEVIQLFGLLRDCFCLFGKLFVEAGLVRSMNCVGVFECIEEECNDVVVGLCILFDWGSRCRFEFL